MVQVHLLVNFHLNQAGRTVPVIREPLMLGVGLPVHFGRELGHAEGQGTGMRGGSLNFAFLMWPQTRGRRSLH